LLRGLGAEGWLRELCQKWMRRLDSGGGDVFLIRQGMCVRCRGSLQARRGQTTRTTTKEETERNVKQKRDAIAVKWLLLVDVGRRSVRLTWYLTEK
jgi:hypothetical protein